MTAHPTLRKLTGILLLSVLLFTACKVTLLSAYDDVTDKTLSEMQQSTTTFFVKHEANPGSQDLSYNNSLPFYEGLRVKSRTVRIRNNAIEKNKIMINMLDLLDENVNLMDSLHKGKPNGLLSKSDVTLLKGAFESQYTAMFKFIMALKARAKAQ
ncbi:hypothetical protein [Paraflavitalea sp. CAU 1676]|uniref:hypothetical protein n=1 Tax=Paraflavitalea sp. CAU 1676 TaxID=3032598 RepID=UPI0023DB6446|nr:hypothetical protein [Paraflavitalea sp. CAU 1676]MDF2187432.1 hypothetical protein [Paraflavitalea sp. CAU 1676]